MKNQFNRSPPPQLPLFGSWSPGKASTPRLTSSFRKFSLGWALLLAGCAADPNLVATPAPTGALAAQNSAEQNQHDVRVNFNFADYYTLTDPNQYQNCAGDVKTYYDPIANGPNGLPSPLPTSAASNDPTVTILPSFVKNV